MKKIVSILIIIAMLSAIMSGCAAKDAGGAEPMAPGAMNGNVYPAEAEGAPEMDGAGPSDEAEDEVTFKENPFISTQEEAVSTFSADVDTASYSYFRKLVNAGYDVEWLQKNGASFRTEEFLNYFKYTANAPQNGELFGVTTAIAPCPWNENTKLMRLTLQAEESTPEGGNNLVFLIDVSGSMGASDKLPLLKKAFSYLVAQLTEQDRVSIVTYSGKEAVVLRGCPGNQGERIMQAVNGLKTSGSTNGEAGMKRAYAVAEENMIAGGNNRIIMASDGDLNVGISSAEELKSFVESKRDTGVYLSILGFGTGNYRDQNMETLADHGNGVYYYIDGESEAEKIFGTDLLSTLYTVAKDTKLQITFDPALVTSYRLIGYENRILNKEDFDDDTKDAGEVGSGHQITVFYELTVNESAAEAEAWMKLAVRYKRPGEETSLLNEYSIGASSVRTPDADFDFQVAIIETCMFLHNSKYLAPTDIDLSLILSNLRALELSADRAEFRALVEKMLG